MTEYHVRSDNMSAENRLLIAALKICHVGQSSPGPMIPHSKRIIRVNFNSRYE